MGRRRESQRQGLWRDHLLKLKLFRDKEQSSRLRTVLTDSARAGVYKYRDSSGAVQAVNLTSLRNFSIDPTGKFLLAANQDSSTIAVFRIDEETGKLAPVGDPAAVPTPVSILYAPRK